VAKADRKRTIKFWKYYQQWIETYKYGIVREVTYAKYENVLRHLKELAPELQLSEVARTDVQRLINQFGHTHEYQTTRDFLIHIQPAFRDAVYEGWLKKDPCYKIQIPSMVHRKKKPKYLEIEDVRKLERAFKDDESGYGDFFDCLLRTGLRFAEALGITPADVDQRNITLDINKSFNYKQSNKTGVRLDEFMPTKNKFSVRKIPIDFQCLADLKKHMEEVPNNESIWVHWFVNSGMLRTGRTANGRPRAIANSTFNHALARICDAAEVPEITVHGLRHIHGSILITNGVSIQSVAKRLGHADTTTTQRVYIHLLKDLENRDTNRIMSVMTGL